MELLFDNNTDYIFDENILKLIDMCILETLESENFNKNFNEKVELSMMIVYNKEIKEINSEFRNIDKPTDVLSFPLLNKEDLDILKTANNINNIISLGDIILSIEKVLEQAKEYNHSIEREVCFLVVHSMLHLLGYDHMVLEEEKEMFKKQDDILNKLNILR